MSSCAPNTNGRSRASSGLGMARQDVDLVGHDDAARRQLAAPEVGHGDLRLEHAHLGDRALRRLLRQPFLHRDVDVVGAGAAMNTRFSLPVGGRDLRRGAGNECRPRDTRSSWSSGSGCAEGLTTRTYIAASAGRRAGDVERERHERPLLLRLQEERRQRHLDVARRGLAGHHAVDQLDQLFDLQPAPACCASGCVLAWRPAAAQRRRSSRPIANATAAASAMTRRLTIIDISCRAANLTSR